MAIETLTQSSLPSDLDEAAKKIVIQLHPSMEDSAVLGDRLTMGELIELVKAGAEWMARQGVSMEVVRGVPWRAVDAFIHDHDYTEDSIIQIRKK